MLNGFIFIFVIKMDKISSLTCPNLTTDQIKNLETNGIKTLFDFLSASKEDVAAAGVEDEEEYSCTRHLIMEHLQPCPITALEMIADGMSVPVSTGLKTLDELLGGGIFPGDIVELYGKSGSGKTQLCLFLTSQFCASENNPCTIYFDLKNDFNAMRLFHLCGGVEKKLEQVKIFREPNLEMLLKQLDNIKDLHIGRIDSFISRCRFMVIDSVPLVMYPAVDGNFQTWRYHQEHLLRRLHWLAFNLKMSIVLVNHSVTSRVEEKDQNPEDAPAIATPQPPPQPEVKPAMGKYWQSKINISIHLQRTKSKDPSLPRGFKGTLQKCYRRPAGDVFQFSIGRNKIEDVEVEIEPKENDVEIAANEGEPNFVGVTFSI